MTPPADRALLLTWLLAQIRQLFTDARERHLNVRLGPDAVLLSELAVDERARGEDES